MCTLSSGPSPSRLLPPGSELHRLPIQRLQWDLAEAKLIEFLEDGQTDHFGRVIAQADRAPLLCIVDPEDIARKRSRYLMGVFFDWWVKANVRRLLQIGIDCRELVLRLMGPLNPHDPSWQLSEKMSLGDLVKEQPFVLSPGSNELAVEFEAPRRSRMVELAVQFGSGFHYTDNPDRREFRARVEALYFRRKSDADRADQ